MTGRHRQAAEQHGATPAQETIRQETAEDRGEVNARCVSAEDRGGERLPIEPAVQGKLAKRVEDHHALNSPGKQEVLHHVKNEERLHPVIGEAFPRLGEGEEPEPARVTEEIGFVFFAGQRRGIIRFGGGGHGAEW